MPRRKSRRLEDVLELAAEHIRARLASAALWGSDRPPTLTALEPLPDSLTSRTESLSEFEMLATVGFLGVGAGRAIATRGRPSHRGRRRRQRNVQTRHKENSPSKTTVPASPSPDPRYLIPQAEDGSRTHNPRFTKAVLCH